MRGKTHWQERGASRVFFTLILSPCKIKFCPPLLSGSTDALQMPAYSAGADACCMQFIQLDDGRSVAGDYYGGYAGREGQITCLIAF